VKLSVFFSSLLGTGFFPVAPGTAGTIVAACVYWLLPESWFSSFPANLLFLSGVCSVSLVSVPIISRAEKILGHDSGIIVMDEFLGFMLAVAFLPKTFLVLILTFVLFRVFDIFKPEPVNLLQKLPQGWGVLADDLMAGIYTNLAVRIILFFVH